MSNISQNGLKSASSVGHGVTIPRNLLDPRHNLDEQQNEQKDRRRATDFRVMLINATGNVGKTTIAKHLLKPRMGCEIINVDSLDDSNSKKLNNMRKVHEELVGVDKAIVDIDASNALEAFEQLRQFHGWQEDYDYYIVPVTIQPKMQSDSIHSMQCLLDMGVDPMCIKVVFNSIDGYADCIGYLDKKFDQVITFMKQKGIPYNSSAVIYQNPYFGRIDYPRVPTRMPIDPDDLTGVKFDEVSKQREELRLKENRTEDENKQLEYLDYLVSTQMLGLSAHKNLDSVFNTLFNKDVAT